VRLPSRHGPCGHSVCGKLKFVVFILVPDIPNYRPIFGTMGMLCIGYVYLDRAMIYAACYVEQSFPTLNSFLSYMLDRLISVFFLVSSRLFIQMTFLVEPSLPTLYSIVVAHCKLSHGWLCWWNAVASFLFGRYVPDISVLWRLHYCTWG
jgi:hypothetical protein